ncbi:hypothetical protein GCM10025859_23730 [Alicyclobacillus fastidiosus]|nr:hypothetical protein GCM10025859_23730 [Alicyclobacillus fastidiosus]
MLLDGLVLDVGVLGVVTVLVLESCVLLSFVELVAAVFVVGSVVTLIAFWDAGAVVFAPAHPVTSPPERIAVPIALKIHRDVFTIHTPRHRF